MCNTIPNIPLNTLIAFKSVSNVYLLFLINKLNNVIKKATIRNRYNQIPTLPETLYGKVTKTQGNITHMNAKMSALSKQEISRLQGTDNENVKHK